MRVPLSPLLDPVYSTEALVGLILHARIIDGRPGGLVVGRRHSEGHVFMYKPRLDGAGKTCGIEYSGALEGGEFLVNHASHAMNKAFLDQINQAGREERQAHPKTNEERALPLDVSASLRVLNTHRNDVDRIILVDERGQFVLNRVATVRNLHRIMELNDRDRDC